MRQAALLDCTLRDGAYIIDKHFGDPVISGIISGLMKAKIDFIEIGFLQNEGEAPGKTIFTNASSARKFIPADKNGCEFAVLADYSRYSSENLEPNPGNSIDIVRECFFKFERYDAINECQRIKDKGYKVFVQPVDILGYSDMELLELIELVNQVEPHCMSIVDTFGSMYEEDLQRIYSMIDHNLISSCKIGFHSHNNMQLSNALSQAFLRMANGKRQVVVDGTISGMGRGAGNTPTELIAQYMISKHGYHYNLDAILDVIDGYMDNIRSRSTWGYTTPYFVAGCYSAHVNNIAYLTKKNSVRSKDIRYILNKIGAQSRKRYDYDLLEQTYLDYLRSDIDDSAAIAELSKHLSGKDVVVIAPGQTASTYTAHIRQVIEQLNAIVITVNFIHDHIQSDYVYVSNVKRYNYLQNTPAFTACKKILTSNVDAEASNAQVVSFAHLVKCGWEHLDNSTIMLLRLLDRLDINSIHIAGFDGYAYGTDGSRNYASDYLELSNVKDNPKALNEEIISMLSEFKSSRIHNAPIHLLTPSRFTKILEG